MKQPHVGILVPFEILQRSDLSLQAKLATVLVADGMIDVECSGRQSVASLSSKDDLVSIVEEIANTTAINGWPALRKAIGI